MLQRRLLRLASLTVLLALGVSTVRAATDEEVEASRKQGMQFLLDSQLEDGSWEYPNHEIGITALCALALIENGTPIDDPAIQRAQQYVLSNYLDETGTYDVTLAILLLSRVGDSDNKSAIRDLAARLVAGQNVEGGWGYTLPKVRSIYLAGGGERPAPPEGTGDNSTTQFAVLGLWVASRWGVNIDETMKAVAERFVAQQNEDGGWPYKHDIEMPQGSRNSMTFAGLFCLTVARATQIRAEQAAAADNKPTPSRFGLRSRTTTRPTTPAATPAEATDNAAAETEIFDPGSEADTLMEDPIFAKGLKKASDFAAGIGNGSSRYFLWSVERMGVMLGMEKFGAADWFDKGSQALLNMQGKPAGENEAIEGAWVAPGTGSALSDTAFAILFLRKANLGSDITRLLEGEPALPFQIVNRDDKPRFFKLQEAIAAAQPGDVIRVDSSLPIDVPHLAIDKDLTIEAGLGYNPALRYEVGFDENGLRSDPKKDPAARYMFAAKAGTLTLEGFRLQFDPPRTAGTGIPWIGLLAEGGNLRLLNCSIAESSRQGFAAVALYGPGKVEIRNCLLVGGRAALEIKTAATQEVHVKNSVLFSNTGISIQGGAMAGERVALKLDRCAVEAPEIFELKNVKTPVDFVSNGVAYMGESLGMNFLPSRTGHEGLTWTGADNLYDLRRWVGYQGTPVASIRDAKTWSQFWGGTDESGDARIVVFAGKRRQGAFSLDVTGEDFDFSSTSQVYAYRHKTGINQLYVGPGYPYTLFREGFDYNAWKEGEEQLAASE
jgi:hypothetical protein